MEQRKEVEQSPETQKRQKAATHAFMLRVAKAQIAAYGLGDTPEEYIRKSVEKAEEDNAQ